MAMLGAGIVLSLMAAAPPAEEPPPSTPRLLVKLEGVATPGQVRAMVENLAGRPVAISVVPAFALRPTGADQAGWPSFRAPLDLRTAKSLPKNGRTRLRMAAKERQTIVVPLESLNWDHYESALWPFRPLRRVVLPGRYDLLLEFEEPASGYWWRSNQLRAIVTKTSTLQLQKPD